MVAMANSNPGVAGAGLIFGSIIGAGVISILIAPIVSRMLRFFPPVVTGTIIAVIGISLMRIGINWIFGNPFGPTAPSIVNPEHAKWLADVGSLANASVTPAAAAAARPRPRRIGRSRRSRPSPRAWRWSARCPTRNTRSCSHIGIAAWCWSRSC